MIIKIKSISNGYTVQKGESDERFIETIPEVVNHCLLKQEQKITEIIQSSFGNRRLKEVSIEITDIKESK